MERSYQVNQQGHLTIGGLDTVKLSQKYGTPLFVYDVNHIRQNARAFVEAFRAHNVKAQIAYASKAFSSIAMVQVAKQEGLSLDVVSQGELYTAIQAGFPMERIHLHGNNKSKEEIEMAVEQQIGCIVIDNFYEIELLQQVLQEKQSTMDVLIRVTPGIEAHTHNYILTGHEDSKFGFNVNNHQATEALTTLLKIDRITVKGVHCHIGSQIFETDGFEMAVQRLYQMINEWKNSFQFETDVLNVGGGFGIRYTAEDKPLPLHEYVDALIKEITQQVDHYQLTFPEIWIEPGRSLVGESAVTLYKIGSIKEIPEVRKYISVDGGMTDNIRPALYEAKYEAVVANKANQSPDEKVAVAGKACESGDMLIWDIDLPKVKNDDILAVFSTGAYSYSMASHYNRFPKAAIVFVEDGHDALVVKRETYEDVVQNDLFYE